MRDHLIADLMRWHADRLGFTIDHAPPAVERRLEELPLPTDMKRLLQWRWPRSSADVGPYELIPAEAILEHEDLSQLLGSRMVPIGAARNGDLLVIHLPREEVAQVGLVSHDVLWEEDGSPIEAYVMVTGTVEEYLHRAAENRYPPIDSVAARELQLLREEERPSGGAA